MNSTLQHAATLRGALIVPWRKGDGVTGEDEQVSYLTVWRHPDLCPFLWTPH